MKLNNFVWIIFILVFVIGCNNEFNFEDQNSPKTLETIIKYDSITLENNCVSLNDSVIIFDNLPKKLFPNVGNVVNGGISTNTPYGFLGRVKSIKNLDNNKTSIFFDRVPITDVINSCNIDTMLTLQILKIQVYDNNGNIRDSVLSNQISSSSFRNALLYDSSLNKKSKVSSIFEFNQNWDMEFKYNSTSLNLYGGVKATFETQISMKIESFSLKEFYYTINPEIQTDFGIKLNSKIAVGENKSTFNLDKIIFKPIVVDVGIILIIVPEIDCNFIFDPNATIYCDFHSTGSVKASLGFRCYEGITTQIATHSVSSNLINFEGGINGNLSTGLEIDAFLCPYYYTDIKIGSKLEIPKFDFNANIPTSTIVEPQNLKAKLDVGVEGIAYAKARLFGLIDYEQSVHDSYMMNIFERSALPEISNLNVTTYGTIQASYFLRTQPLFSFKNHGFCWSLSSKPTINDNKNSFGALNMFSVTNDFNTTISNLESNKTYYIRPYFEGSLGVYYGEEQSFTTKQTDMSITVGDNGSAADDAFEVYLNDHFIGTTTIGATNTIGLDNLKPGPAILEIKCIIAPDNIGTLGITLNNGISLYNSNVSTISDEMKQGESKQWVINIPTKATNKISRLLIKNQVFEK